LAIIGVSQSLSQAQRLLETAMNYMEIDTKEAMRRFFRVMKTIWDHRLRLLNYKIGEKVFIRLDEALQVILPPKNLVDEATEKFRGELPEEHWIFISVCI